MEKLFVQIFERRNRIIEQVKQQTELYDQNLASKLLIQGITPPSWLWNPKGSSDSKELNKEELISKLLGPYTQASVRSSAASYPLYHKPLISGANQDFSDGFLMETLNNCPNGLVCGTRGNADAGCSLNPVSELGFSITSPEGQTTERFLNIHNAPDQSLGRIQRSKSRQKALELRNSANAVAENGLNHENISGLLSRRIRLSISSPKQMGNEDELPEFEEPCAFGSSCYEDLDFDEAACQNKDNDMDLYSGKITRSGSCVKILRSGRTLGHLQNDEKDVSFHGGNTINRSSVCSSSHEVADYHSRLLHSVGSSAAFGQNEGDIRLERAGSLSKEKGVIYSGKDSRFRSSHRHQCSATDSWKADSSSNDAQRMVGTIVDFGDDLHKDHINGSPVKKNIFDVAQGSILEGGKSYKESNNISEPVHCSDQIEQGNWSGEGGTKGNEDELPELEEPCAFGSSCYEDLDLDEAACKNKNNDVDLYSGKITRSGSRVKILCSGRTLGHLQNDGKDVSFHGDNAINRSSVCISSHEVADCHSRLLHSAGSSAAFSQNDGDIRLERAGSLSKEKGVVYSGNVSPFRSSHRHQCSATDSWKADSSSNDAQRMVGTIMGFGDDLHKDHNDESGSPVKKDIFDVGQGSIVEGGKSYKESSNISEPVHCSDHIGQSNWSGEGSTNGSEVSHATGSKYVGQYYFSKLADNPGKESHDFLIGQPEMVNPISVAQDKIQQHPAHESQILSCLIDTPVEENRLVTTIKSTKRGEDSLPEGRFGLVSIESWPQRKRRRIEELQMNRLTSCPIPVKHVGSIQRDSPSRYLRNIEMDVITGLADSLDLKMDTDIEMDKDKEREYINSENLTLTTRLFQATKSTPTVDGQQSQCLVLSPKSEDQEFVAASVPVFEVFNVDTQADSGDLNFALDGVDLAKFSLSRIAIERASIVEEMCRSASLDTPMSHLSSALNFQGTVNAFQSLPNGLLEHLDLKTNVPLNINVHRQLDSGKSLVNDAGGYLERIERMPYSVNLPYSGARYGWNSRIQHASPVGRLWDRLSSHSESSEKCSISNPELKCFPIEEDTCISEDNKRLDEIANDVEEETDSLLTYNCNVRHPLKDLTNMGLNPSVSTFAQWDILRADTVDIMSAKSNVSGTQDEVQWSSKNQCQHYSEMRVNQRSSLGNSKVERNQTLPIGANGTKKAKESFDENVSRPTISSKTSLKRQEQNVSLKDSKRNNIVSNISSFIPLVQQKQAAAVCAGKRDVKVKALEVAEAAKRLEEKRMNERKSRKEALKLERARMEAENLRKMELEKKRKELERKKKDADAIGKKRLREEEEIKEKEKKRMRLEARLCQREQEERGRAEKAKKEKWHTKADDQINSKKSFNEFKKEQDHGVVRRDGVASKKDVIEECGTSNYSFEAEKVLPTVNISPKNEDLIVQKRQEKSYEISPYQCSDDEDEEDEELPTKKYIPSWASKSSVAQLLPLQRKMEPDFAGCHDNHLWTSWTASNIYFQSFSDKNGAFL